MTRIILIVLSTVNLEFQGWFVPISLRPVLRIVVAQVYSPEKAMVPHSSILAWKIPWVEEPGRLQSMRSLRVGHD